METRDIGKRRFVLWGTLYDKAHKPLVFRQPTFELDPPYRYANAIVIKLARWGIMLGTWEKSPAKTLQEHFMRALDADAFAGYTEEELAERTDLGAQRVIPKMVGGDPGPFKNHWRGRSWSSKGTAWDYTPEVIDEEPL